jgi:hypothetical protein
MDMRYALFRLVCLCLFSFFLLEGCSRGKVPFNEPSDLRGKSMEELQQMQKQILQEKAGKILSDEELACIEMIREQERRLENPWIFGEWRERHGQRLIFRDDGTVSVGARNGAYDELGIYKYFSAEEPSYETVWTLLQDASGDPVAMISHPYGENLLYPFHKDRGHVYEQIGDMQISRETGCYFTKVQ